MTDVFTTDARSKFMAGVRTVGTKPERIVARALFAAGFRYRLTVKALPGKPDLVLPKCHAVILVHGCFWHGHDCRLFKWPKSREAFWRAKIGGNQERDRRQRAELAALGWRVCVVWECATRDPHEVLRAHIARITGWLNTDVPELEVRS